MSERVHLTQRRMLWSIFCAPKGATEDAIAEEVAATDHLPWAGSDLVRSRLFGGFACDDDPARVHVVHAAGEYSYLEHAINEPLTAEERERVWREILEGNAGKAALCSGPFADDRPGDE